LLEQKRQDDREYMHRKTAAEARGKIAHSSRRSGLWP
jgi:hypothetical protein